MNKKIILLISCFYLNNFAFASEATLGRILDVKGAGFMSTNGQTHEVSKGAVISGNTEISVEHNGQITLIDNYDHKITLSNSASVAVTTKGLVLRSGNIWVQSNSKNENYKIFSANSLVELDSGEGIVTYDTSTGKTQLMVINGLMKISNLRTKELNVTVSEGNFSYVDNGYDEGAPRDPTPVGRKTYQALIGEFKGIAPMDKNSEKLFKESSEKNIAQGSHVPEAYKLNEEHHEVKRSLASVEDEKEKGIEKDSKNLKINEENNLLEVYKENLLDHKTKKKVNKVVDNTKEKNTKAFKKVNKQPVMKSSPLVVQVFGRNTESSLAKTSRETESDGKSNIINKRMPASVESNDSSDEKLNSKQLIKKINNVHSEETNKLIDTLKNL